MEPTAKREIKKIALFIDDQKKCIGKRYSFGFGPRFCGFTFFSLLFLGSPMPPLL